MKLSSPAYLAKNGGELSEELNNAYAKLPNHLKAKFFSQKGETPLDEASQLLEYNDEAEMLSLMDLHAEQLVKRLEAFCCLFFLVDFFA